MKKNIILPDGTFVNNLGIGTWYMGDNPNKKSEEIECIRYALDNGIKIIDTAEMYGSGNSERLIGEAIKGYNRSSIFLISKVLPSNAGKNKIFQACENSLKRLGTDYLDMYLLHWRGMYSFEETFECMEELKKVGKIRRWGVSNMDIEDMIEIQSTPYGKECQVNQILYHLGSRGIEYSLKPFMDSKGIPTIAYCPLAQGGRLKEKLLKSISVKKIAEKYGITPIQTLLSFVLSQENMIAIPKASYVEHMKQNIECLNIHLDDEDLMLLNKEYPKPTKKLPLDIE
ncbi:MAG: aldo/keto reductase [Fusobacterium mortiferum]|jgi:diketogulonate reductase-like aldo/keto reductase|uniref:aldo/keto reductase n=1 Tax=Fusobacterium sp. FSA-380-WT-2B TaxID=2605786 RepID=UPI0012B2C7BD|nr:aldo/keto reductase [Fusobacterium sp. FSA-380-WT-2B]MCI7188067.1 aldo/keto reductase [Fusobacterium mortiferum]MCI7666356.1 aldo/keto reductase [Fusobacterium mortiferum]MSS61373.1 aldo/keto reductase [Fusobacterium sp. FSA-380-WT-2B]